VGSVVGSVGGQAAAGAAACLYVSEPPPPLRSRVQYARARLLGTVLSLSSALFEACVLRCGHAPQRRRADAQPGRGCKHRFAVLQAWPRRPRRPRRKHQAPALRPCQRPCLALRRPVRPTGVGPAAERARTSRALRQTQPRRPRRGRAAPCTARYRPMRWALRRCRSGSARLSGARSVRYTRVTWACLALQDTPWGHAVWQRCMHASCDD